MCFCLFVCLFVPEDPVFDPVPEDSVVDDDHDDDGAPEGHEGGEEGVGDVWVEDTVARVVVDTGLARPGVGGRPDCRMTAG